jgi:hypothetical protein
MQRLREVRDWREALGKSVGGGPVRVAREEEANDPAAVDADYLVSAANTIQYVYGIVRPPAWRQPMLQPGSKERRSVSTVAGRCAHIVSLDAEEYSPDLIEERVGDVEWLAPRAEAHDAVVSWAGNPGPVVPLHMWALFSSRDAVVEMLESRAAELVPRAGAPAWCGRIRAARVRGPGRLESVAADDAAVAALERSAASAGPGQRYLIERKLERARRDAAAGLQPQRADRHSMRWRPSRSQRLRDEIPNGGLRKASAVLSAAFLVRRDDIDAFRAALTALVRETRAEGVQVLVHGPWPPYHFTAVEAE